MARHLLLLDQILGTLLEHRGHAAGHSLAGKQHGSPDALVRVEQADQRAVARIDGGGDGLPGVARVQTVARPGGPRLAPSRTSASVLMKTGSRNGTASSATT